MSIISPAKLLLKKLFSPFLQYSYPKHRFIIIHDVSKSYINKFDSFLSFINSLDSIKFTLTFDDGFRSSYNVIRKLENIKAIFFVCPSFLMLNENKSITKFLHNNFLLEDNYTNENDLRPVEWGDLIELTEMGHIVGTHTSNHVRLSQISSQKKLENEIIGSGDILEDKLNARIEWFSYPFGNIKSINEKAYKIIKKRYKYCCTGIRGNNISNQSPYAIWRDPIDLSWPLDYIEFVLNGGLDWYYYYKRKRIIKMIGN